MTNVNGASGSRYDLAVPLSGYVEPRGDHWVAFNHQLGITTYGDTRDVAEERLWKALDLVIVRIARRGPDALRARFASAGVPVLLEPVDEAHRKTFERLEQRELVLA